MILQNKIKFILVFIILIVASYCVFKIWKTLQNRDYLNKSIQQLPSITFQKLNRNFFQLDSLKDNKQLLILNYFSPGCDHCQNMVKEMLHEQNRIKNVRWLMITSEKIETIKPFVDCMHLDKLSTVTILSDTSFKFAKRYGIVSIPSFFVYHKGQLIRKHSGECSVKYLVP